MRKRFTRQFWKEKLQRRLDKQISDLRDKIDEAELIPVEPPIPSGWWVDYKPREDLGVIEQETALFYLPYTFHPRWSSDKDRLNHTRNLKWFLRALQKGRTKMELPAELIEPHVRALDEKKYQAINRKDKRLYFDKEYTYSWGDNSYGQYPPNQRFRRLLEIDVYQAYITHFKVDKPQEKSEKKQLEQLRDSLGPARGCNYGNKYYHTNHMKPVIIDRERVAHAIRDWKEEQVEVFNYDDDYDTFCIDWEQVYYEAQYMEDQLFFSNPELYQ